eukprot:scaffold394254_cov19-Prasinocladus_malaysianus.AAC.1
MKTTFKLLLAEQMRLQRARQLADSFSNGSSTSQLSLASDIVEMLSLQSNTAQALLRSTHK